MEDHWRHSTLRETVVEHLFLAGLLRGLWQKGCRDFEVLRASTDTAGYDLAVEARGVLRHIQLKSSVAGARTACVNVNRALAAKPCGCVVWLFVEARSLEFAQVLWLGNPPGRSLPDLGDRVARHTKADSTGKKAPREALRTVAKGRFEPLDGIEALVGRLFPG